MRIALKDREPLLDISVFSGYFDQLRELLFQTYEIDYSDAVYSVDVLIEFFKLKKETPESFLILPQIADWAWHEFIVDTKNYHQFCDQYFGYYLDHVKAEKNSDTEVLLIEKYNATKQVFNALSELRFDEEFWVDCGWKSPEYRFREVPNYESAVECEELGDDKSSIDLFWIKDRLIERFGWSGPVSDQAIDQYKAFLSRKTMGGSVLRSSYCDFVWREHILWTERYRSDCQALFGSYFHRPSLGITHGS
ncbi:glycine-rich domain-containing protein [Oleiphilus messinensis]|nr:hypothetical protein [Oleiphilus messinensis]